MTKLLEKLLVISAEGGNVVLTPEESAELINHVHRLQDKADLLTLVSGQLTESDEEKLKLLLANVLEGVLLEVNDWKTWGIENGELLKAAVCIMKVRSDVIDGARARRMGYPWKKETWKDEDRVRNLRRSIGLLLCELARWEGR